MDEKKRHIPSSWETTSLQELFAVVGGGTPSTKVEEYWKGEIPWVTSADINGDSTVHPKRYITEDAISNSATNKVPEDTVLVVTRVGLGKVAIVDKPICFSQDVQGLVAGPVAPNALFMSYLLRHHMQRLKYESRGTTIAGLTKKQLKDLPIDLPPLPEQHRIVSKIEELFSELDNSVACLKKAKEQLKVYRQAVLKHAFEGKLTAKWREKNKDKLESADALLERIKNERSERYEQQVEEWKQAVKAWEDGGKEGKKPSKPKKLKEVPTLSEHQVANLAELPVRWRWIQFGEAFRASPQNGIYKPASAYGQGNQIIRIDDFYDGSLVKRAGFKRLALNEDEKTTYSVQENNILVNRVNSIEYLGKCCLIEGLTEPTVFESNIMRIQILENCIDPKYLTLFLSSRTGQLQLQKNAKHAVNQASINQTDVGNALFPLCSYEEQIQLVEAIEASLSVINNVEAVIAKQLQTSATLRQSILKKAFEGQLVAQDPADEPASALLERIKAEMPSLNGTSKRKVSSKRKTA